MIRPHPAVWRLVHGIVVVYLLFMVFLLFQNVDDARQFLKVWEWCWGCGGCGYKPAALGGSGGISN